MKMHTSPASRRSLLRAASASAALAMLTAGRRALASATSPRTLLILGGTGFIGPHLTEEALRRGWRVTHFNRGRRSPAGAAGVETLRGDRSGALEALRGRRWDAVIDNTGYVPSYVKASSELLAPAAGYALFISSISAYASFAKPNDENAATGVLDDVATVAVTNDTYGPMKALCERYVMDAFAGRASVVRPGYIVGPLDTSDRFTYWPVRVARGGRMLAPGTPGDPIQIIDVRDLAAWMMTLVEARATGTYNAVSAPRQFSIGDIIAASARVVGRGAAEPIWIPEEFLAKRWKPEQLDLPPWAPLSGDSAGASLTPTDRARAAGLRIRPLETTVRDTLAWFRTLPAERQAKLKAGLPAERELETLVAWDASQSTRRG
jgi:2'-hydroxyisoflavone reductase